MKLFFAKLTLLIACAAALVGYEYRAVEEEIQALGRVHGSVEAAAKMVQLLRKVPSARVIIAGDSKAERQVDPQLFLNIGVPAINAGVPSFDLWTLVQTLEALGLNQLPATFLISVGSYQINDGHNDKGAYTPELFFSYTPWERLNIFKSGYFVAARAMLKQKKLYQDYPLILQRMAQGGNSYPALGFLPIEPSDYGCQRFRHNSGVSPYSSYRNIAIDGGRWRLFQEAVKKLAQWPGRYALYNSLHTQKGLDCMAGTYGERMEREFSRKAGELIRPLNNVRFLDFFFRQGEFVVDDHYFYDPGHLDRNGAQRFTEWWIAYLKRENWL